MANFFSDNEDLKFQYTHGFRWEELARVTELDYTLTDGPKNLEEAKAFYDEVVSLVGELAAEKIAPQAAQIDREGAHLEDGEVVTPKAMHEIEKACAEAGYYGMALPRELGGSNAPMAVYFACTELVGRADVSLLTHLGFYGGTAIALLAYSIQEGSAKPGAPGQMFGATRFDAEIRDIIAGKNWGCMVLTEPDCGSDLGAIRSTGTLRDGKWYVNGNKIYITSGHGEYEIVLARTEPAAGDAMGLKGLSLFFVRRHLERDAKRVVNVVVDKVEEKLGHHGSATCSLVYEDSEAELIGERGQGFELMLLMMNGARIAVGFESIGLCQAAYNMASEYAELRRTMGKPIAEHELVAEMLLDMDTDIRGMRALAVECVNHQELAHKYELLQRLRPPQSASERAELDKKISKAKRRSRELTPLLKYIGGEKAVEIARKNMQIHGGAGYMADVGAEKLLRDALVVPVYEGTSQIQALMALKDHLLFVMREPALFAKRMSAASIGATTAKTQVERQLCSARLEIYRSMTHLLGRIAGKKLRSDLGRALRQVPAHEWPRYLTHDFMREWDMKVDFSYGLLHAERLTRMLVDVEIGTILLNQATLFPHRRIYAERHIRRMLPRVRHMSEEIRGGDTSVFDWLRERAAKLTAQKDAA